MPRRGDAWPRFLAKARRFELRVVAVRAHPRRAASRLATELEEVAGLELRSRKFIQLEDCDGEAHLDHLLVEGQ